MLFLVDCTNDQYPGVPKYLAAVHTPMKIMPRLRLILWQLR